MFGGEPSALMEAVRGRKISRRATQKRVKALTLTPNPSLLG
jgi:hypothetical protein